MVYVRRPAYVIPRGGICRRRTTCLHTRSKTRAHSQRRVCWWWGHYFRVRCVSEWGRDGWMAVFDLAESEFRNLDSPWSSRFWADNNGFRSYLNKRPRGIIKFTGYIMAHSWRGCAHVVDWRGIRPLPSRHATHMFLAGLVVVVGGWAGGYSWIVRYRWFIRCRCHGSTWVCYRSTRDKSRIRPTGREGTDSSGPE